MTIKKYVSILLLFFAFSSNAMEKGPSLSIHDLITHVVNDHQKKDPNLKEHILEVLTIHNVDLKSPMDPYKDDIISFLARISAKDTLLASLAPDERLKCIVDYIKEEGFCFASMLPKNQQNKVQPADIAMVSNEVAKIDLSNPLGRTIKSTTHNTGVKINNMKEGAEALFGNPTESTICRGKQLLTYNNVSQNIELHIIPSNVADNSNPYVTKAPFLVKMPSLKHKYKGHNKIYNTSVVLDKINFKDFLLNNQRDGKQRFADNKHIQCEVQFTITKTNSVLFLSYINNPSAGVYIRSKTNNEKIVYYAHNNDKADESTNKDERSEFLNKILNQFIKEYRYSYGE